jgi:nucleotide-binding universal stress UspA family protein
MSVKIIVSYDGTNNENDAIALGRLLARAGGEIALAYVRHTHEPESASEALAQSEAEALLKGGAELLGQGEIPLHVVSDRSTPEGLRALAEREGAGLVVFCSDSHTAKGRIGVGNSAQRLLENGPVAVGVAPAGFAQLGDPRPQLIVPIGDPQDTSPHKTARDLAEALGGSVGELGSGHADLLVVGSRPEAEPGRVAVSAATERKVEDATCPLLVLPRGVALPFEGALSVSA